MSDLINCTCSSCHTQRTMEFVSGSSFNWTIACAHRNAVVCRSQKIEFSLQPIKGLPATTWLLFMTSEGTGNTFCLRLHYNCLVRDGGAIPTFRIRICALEENVFEGRVDATLIHDSAYRNTGSCFYLDRNDRRALTLQVNLELFRGENYPLAFPEDYWNIQHSNSKKAQFLNMLNNGHLSDVKIVSKEGIEFWAHKFMLCAGSDVFQAMFRNDTIESRTGVVKLGEMSAKAVKFLIYFIYTSEILTIAPDEIAESGRRNATVGEVLYLAEKYGLLELKSFIDQCISGFCIERNAWDLLRLCDTYNLQSGKKVVYDFLNKNQIEVEIVERSSPA